jgi:hypothetical protein
MKLQVSGFAIFLSFIIGCISYFFIKELFIFSGIFAWLALILLFKDCTNIKLLIVLLGLSFIAFLYSFLNGFDIDFKRAILVNQYLLTLLIGVGFLRLIATPKNEKIKELPKGKTALFKTYLGVHLFGSVINLTSLILVADRLYKDSPISKLQYAVLTRAFSSDAYWSPFFVAFAAALTYAPNLSTKTILPTGIFLAVVGFLLTYLEVIKKYEISEFRGYPIHFETLYIPFILALLVIGTNHYYPHIKVILLIASFSFLLSIIILPAKIGLVTGYKKLYSYMNTELPQIKNELSLFLVAGLFGVSMSSILVGLNIDLPFHKFDGLSASILLFVLVFVSFFGIHPIISIAVIGSWMGELNHTLLASTFLMSWSISVSASPFSGLNLTMQARYNLKVKDIFKINIIYAVKMYFVCVIILFLLSNYLGI